MYAVVYSRCSSDAITKILVNGSFGIFLIVIIVTSKKEMANNISSAKNRQ